MATTFHGFTLASNMKRIQSRHPRVELPEQEEYTPNYFIRLDESSWVITGENPKLMQRFQRHFSATRHEQVNPIPAMPGSY
jgi:hypothetical protein